VLISGIISAPKLSAIQCSGQSCWGFVSDSLPGAGLFIGIVDEKGTLFGGGWLVAKDMWFFGW